MNMTPEFIACLLVFKSHVAPSGVTPEQAAEYRGVTESLNLLAEVYEARERGRVRELADRLGAVVGTEPFSTFI